MNIAVCGTGIISAVGNNRIAAYDSLINGRSGIAPLSILKSGIKTYSGEVKLNNRELKEILGISSKKVISRTALLGMIAAAEAVKDAGIPDNARVGLISATTVGGMDLSEHFYKDFITGGHIGNLHYISGHACASSTEMIAAHCGITGFRTTISTACSSAANAVILAARMVERGTLDYAVAGGTDALCLFTLNGFNSLMILSEEPCRPFDNNRSGITLGEGAGYIVLAKRGKAKKEHCFLSGYANANDAFHQTASSGNGDGAYMAMKQALKKASLKPEDIDYINLHGTGTRNNDLSEGRALQRLFGKKLPAFSSTKGYTGHTLAAAGGIEAVLSITALTTGAIYKNTGFSHPMKELPLLPALECVTGTVIKHVMSNSFGFGGNCSSLIFSGQ